MGKPAPAKSKEKPPSKPRSRWWLHGVGLVLLIGAIIAGAKFSRGYVERKVAVQTKPPTVVLKDRPSWMSDVLADQITAAVQPDKAHSTFDHQVLIETAKKLQANPWVEKVRLVRRGYDKTAGDTLEIDAVYRTPVALVKWGDYYSLIDNQGVKLPEQYPKTVVERIVRGRDGRINIRVIEGVFEPPPDPGKTWRGDDVQAGLQMVKLLFDKPFAQDIYKVNVQNFARRKSAKEAQLTLKTRYGTEIRWGRPPSAADFFIEVSTDQKLDSLQQIYQQYGRVDAKQPWLDVRFDKITYPAEQAVAQ